MSDARAGSPQSSLVHGGECGRLIASRDWSSTSLGALEEWPQSLRTMLGFLLRSPVPIVLLWGEDGVMLYNDAYSVFAGGRHPELLGSNVREGWPEVADFNDNVMRVGLAGGTLAYKDQELTLHRHGRPEQVFMNLDYSPVLDESGRPAGVLAIVVETTERVAAERRQAFVVALGDALRDVAEPVALTATAAELLGRHLGVGRAGYGEIDAAGEVVSVKQDWTDGTMASLAGEARVLDAFGPEVIAELRTGRTLVVEDCLTDARTSHPDHIATWESIGTRSLIVAPLMDGDRLVAILYVHSAAPRRWSKLDARLVEDVGGRTWAAVERARAEAALKASGERLSRSHAAARLGDFTWDVATDALSLSGEYPRLLGLAPDALPTTASAYIALVYPDDRSRLAAEVALILANQAERLDTEYRVVRGDGEVAWITVSAQAEGRQEDGKATRIIGVNYDVTGRRQAEAALRESEARFRLMADAVPQIVWITDMEGRAEFFNKQWFDYTGIPVMPASAAQVAADHVHPDDAVATMAAFDEARRTGTTFLVEHRVRSASGDYRWFLVRGEPYRDPASGEVVRWFGASVDIHGRRLAEERLRELNDTLERRVAEALAERNMLAKLVELTDVMILAIDLDYNILALNAANANEFERIYGVRPKAGDNMLELLNDWPEHQEQVRAGWARGMQGEQVTFVEDYGDPGRARPYYAVSFRPLLNDAGEQIGVYQFVTDVTDRLRQEAQLSEAQEALRQSQKMEAIGQLTGGVAHDFNNLLMPIIGALDMLQRRGLGDEREQRLIAGAMQSAERAKTLVQRLLAFARRQPLQSVAVDIGKLVEGMGDLVSSTTGPQIKVVVEAPDDLPPAKVDPNQVEMALLNLAVNARDAMPDGGTLLISASAEKIGVEHRAKLRPDTYIRLSVADTGTGMDEATLARAVEPFFSTKGIGKGTGLGLSMVHGLSSQLGGALTIQSQPGLGTTVELWLPRSAATPEAIQPLVGVPEALVARGTALLVDDEELVRMSTADMLSDLGYAVIEAASGEEAMRLVDGGERFDLLVTDHLMPGLTGTDLARAVRSARPNVPVLLVSGYAEREGVDPDLPQLTKPFRKDELASRLAQLRRGGSEHRSPPRPAE